MRVVIEGVPGEIDSLPGCSQIAVSHSVFLPEHKRGKGQGSAAHAARLEALKQLGYDYVICTVQTTNIAQVRLMEKFTWSPLEMFVSTKTGHSVRLYGRRL